MLSTRPLDVDRRALTKTPGRALLKSRSALQENAVLHTTRPISKLLPAHTPYAFAPKQPPPGDKTHVPGEKSRPAARPLGDKTPFPNRTNLNFEPRPSSTRKHPRGPRQSFETPVTAGYHWDVSDISIDAPAVGGGPIEEALAVEDYGDVEYMPPKVLEIPYAPMFDLPDYKNVGRTMVALAHSYPVDDTPAPVVGFTDADVDFFAFEGLVLPELGDDNPFANFVPLSKPTPCAPSATRNVSRPGTSAVSRAAANIMSRPATSTLPPPATGATSRPATSLASRPVTSAAYRPAKGLTSRPASSLARPTTSTAPRPPTVATARPATSVGTVRPKHTLARPASAMTARGVATTATRVGSRDASTATARGVNTMTITRGVSTTTDRGPTLGTRGLGSNKQEARGVVGKPATHNGAVTPQGNENNALVLAFSSVGFDEEGDFRFDI
ncbi:hypothetical protein BV22DRAFT_1133577 [Leucogyrophana mollusca]|uniref:Uncharacterized protein n=1 Tax=Leucogyrophana mollusca TaxID=85980 RepID=A0ACB8B3I4_9AGAM|nr:hypothetical protein BV22DRAFT_1133577 [Leucogyrophana mollusca]